MSCRCCLFLLLLLVTVGCQATPSTTEGADVIRDQADAAPVAAAPANPTAAVPTPAPTPTSTVAPTSTPLPPTATASPTPTATPEPSPTAMLNPPLTGYHLMAYDSESDLVIVVPRYHEEGGRATVLSDQTWVLDLDEGSWEMRTGAPDGSGFMAYDIQSDRSIFFIGYQLSGRTPISDAQTWAYDANTDTWTNMQPAESPSGVVGARMVYDSESDRIILVGGSDAQTWSDMQETWAYDFETNTWTNMQPEIGPPPGYPYMAAAYDPVVDRVIVWRGGAFDTTTMEHSYTIGAYDYNSNTWEHVVPNRVHPRAHMYAAMVYDPGMNREILFGGLGPDEAPLHETWAYDYPTNTWTRLSTQSHPSDRGWHTMVYDSQAGVIVLFGGGANRSEFTDETWVFDPETGEWTDYTVRP